MEGGEERVKLGEEEEEEEEEWMMDGVIREESCFIKGLRKHVYLSL